VMKLPQVVVRGLLVSFAQKYDLLNVTSSLLPTTEENCESTGRSNVEHFVRLKTSKLNNRPRLYRSTVISCEKPNNLAL
jgi:hypothetical protein